MKRKKIVVSAQSLNLISIMTAYLLRKTYKVFLKSTEHVIIIDENGILRDSPIVKTRICLKAKKGLTPKKKSGNR